MMKWNGGSNAPILKMKKYLIIKDTMSGGKRVHSGDVIEVTESEGMTLVSCHKAELFVEKEQPKKSDRSVGLEKSETKAPKKRAKK